MPDLNETVQFTVQESTTLSVPVDSTLSIEGQAADAAAVGRALATKQDAGSVVIKVNEQEQDNQGQIILRSDDIPIAESSPGSVLDALNILDAKNGSNILYNTGSTDTVKAKIDAAQTAADAAAAKTGADILYNTGSTDTVKAKIDAAQAAADAAAAACDAKTASTIVYEGTTTIKSKVDAVEGSLGNVIRYAAQTLTSSQKDQAAANIGAVTALEEPSESALTDAQKGYARTNIGAAAQTAVDAIQTLMGSNYSAFSSRDISSTFPVSNANITRITSNSAWLYRFGRICIFTFAFNVTAAITAGQALLGFPTSADGSVTYTPSGHVAGMMSRQWAESNNATVLYRDSNVISSVGPVEAGQWRGFVIYAL